jgi:hypothetical protein
MAKRREAIQLKSFLVTTLSALWLLKAGDILRINIVCMYVGDKSRTSCRVTCGQPDAGRSTPY